MRSCAHQTANAPGRRWEWCSCSGRHVGPSLLLRIARLCAGARIPHQTADACGRRQRRDGALMPASIRRPRQKSATLLWPILAPFPDDGETRPFGGRADRGHWRRLRLLPARMGAPGCPLALRMPSHLVMGELEHKWQNLRSRGDCPRAVLVRSTLPDSLRHCSVLVTSRLSWG